MRVKDGVIDKMFIEPISCQNLLSNVYFAEGIVNVSAILIAEHWGK